MKFLLPSPYLSHQPHQQTAVARERVQGTAQEGVEAGEDKKAVVQDKTRPSEA
jgi:hypothetical protein